MNTKQFTKKLKELEACQGARDWAKDKTWTEVYATCEKGDWLLWLFAKTNDTTPDSSDYRLIKLAAGLCANEVKHLMKDERSINAVDVAIAYGEGRASNDELNAVATIAASASAVTDASASAAASAAYYAASSAAASAAYYTASSAAAVTYYAASSAAAVAYYAAAYAAAAHAAAHAAYASAKKDMQLRTADIVRSIIPIENFNL